MSLIRNFTLSAILALVSCQGGAQGDNPSPTPEDTGKAAYAKAYTTSTGGQMMKESQIRLGKPEDVHSYKVSLNGETFQSVDGFGMAITHATCFNLLKMSSEKRTAFLKEVFSREEGIGSSLIRICIGGSDFSMDEYTWCDWEGIDNFAVHSLDEGYLFPILDEIFKINPKVRIIASPWSCPKWMKMSEDGKKDYDSWTGGRLDPDHYQDYAIYFVKWIQAMEQRGYPIYAVTLQNEPLNRGNSMSLYMPWQDQRDFIKQAVGPAFRKAGLKTKILLFDHNYNYDNISSQADYPLHIFEDSEASQYVSGSAWHNYGGSVTTLDKIHGSYPDKEIYFTEASIGTWNYTYGTRLIEDFRDIFLGTLARHGKGVTLWNLMLDDQRRPYRPGGCSTCFGAVTVSSSGYDSITRNSQYYDVAQCSKVLQPGAVRMGTTGFETAGISYLWFKNPDGTHAVLILNESSADVLLNFVTDNVNVPCRIPPKAIQSVIWEDKAL